MKAIIKKGLPEEAQCYYELPIFDAQPIMNMRLWMENFLCNEFKTNDIEYWLYFEYNTIPQGILYQAQFDMYQWVELTEYQIHKINELYFHMLNHPEIKEMSINL